MTNTESEIEALIREFASKLVEMTEADMRQRAIAAVSSAVAGAGSRSASVASTAAGAPAKRTLQLTPKGIAARKLQGQYLGMLRGLSAGNRLRVKKVAREQGVAAALKLGNTLK